jgi:hypothetical protein
MTDLLVWSAEAKQIFTTPKIRTNTNYKPTPRLTKRLFTYDPAYADQGLPGYRYGSYLYSENNTLVGFWEPHNLSDFPAEFRANLLLLGVAYEHRK